MKIGKLFVLILSGIESLAAQSVPMPPAGPLLNRAPKNAAWVIETKSLGATLSSSGGGIVEAKFGSDSPGSQKRMTVIKNGNLVYEQITQADGAVVETWRAAGQEVISVPGKGAVMIPGGGTSFNRADYVNSDFAGFDWISAANFVGMRKVMGKNCMIFRGKTITKDPQELRIIQNTTSQAISEAKLRAQESHEGAINSNLGAEKGSVKAFSLSDYEVNVVAYIDSDTKLPVLLQYATEQGEAVRIYEFQAQPATLSIPPDVLKILDNYIQQKRSPLVSKAPI